MSRRKIYFSLSTGWALRNFVSSGVVARLAETHKIHLIYPSKFEKFISSQCKSDNLERTHYDAGEEPFFWRVVRQARKKIYLNSRASATEHVWEVFGRRPTYKIFGARVLTAIVRLFGTQKVTVWLEKFDYFCNNRSAANKLFSEEVGGNLFIATHASTFQDESLHRAAIDGGCRTILLVLSWDHLSSKIVLGSNFDKLLVWNEVSRVEALRTLGGYDESSVRVVGAPQFDVYANQPGISYAGWCKRSGLDPRRGFILFSTMPQVRHDGQHLILRVLGEALKDRPERFKNLQLFVKPHPFDKRSIYQSLENDGLIKLMPSYADGATPAESWLPSSDAALATRDALYFSSMNINIFSTMTLEAAYFDKPIIHIAYDVPGQTNPIPCREYYKFEHFRPIADTGCSRLVADNESLLDAVEEAASHPERRAAERRQVVERYFSVAPGRAASLVVHEIQSMADVV